jgi:hypothetical protein
MMRTVYRGNFIDLHQRREVFDAFFRQHRSLVEDADRWHNEARRTLAREALWNACRAYDRDEVELSQADKLEDFALETYPDATSLGEYAALGRRRRLGPGLCNLTQIFAAPALMRRMHRWRLKRRWKKRGE